MLYVNNDYCLRWGMAEPPQKKRRPNFTDEELHALTAAIISRKKSFIFQTCRENKIQRL